MPIDAPLTFGQLSTWRSVETFAADRLAEVNVFDTCDLRSLPGLRTDTVLEALRCLTEEHEALRTTYHLVDGRWHEVNPPAGIWDQQPETLTWIPGTRSVWGTATGLTNKGNYGVIIKYGP